MQDFIWIIIASAFILLMQAGFTCLETGLVRSKNSINVAIKNLMDLCLCSAIFWVLGYGVMFGSSINGFLGWSDFFFSGELDPKSLAFFVFQMLYCGTAITIISGAVAERMSFKGYMLISAITSVLIYPIVGHWVWAGLLEHEPLGWLGQLGFIDFSGSTVVHSVGGWVALSAIIIIGPRTGRFENGGTIIQGSNLTFSVLGIILLWFGWFGFNAGSTFAISDKIPLIVVNTCLSAVFSGLTAILLQCKLRGSIDVVSGINGVLGGLVAITAGCHLMTPSATVGIAVIAGAIVVMGERLLEKYQIDDAINVVPVHLFCGIWGTLAIAFFSKPETWNNGLNFVSQLNVQLLGILVVGLYSFCISYLCIKLSNFYIPLRVNLKAEQMGLNVSEHRVTTETLELFKEMELYGRKGDYTSPVNEEPFTEAGQIARQYNQMLARVNEEINQRERAIDWLKAREAKRNADLSTSLDCIITIDKNGMIQEFNPASEKCFGYSRQQVLGRNFAEYFVSVEMHMTFNENLAKNFSADSRLTLDRHNQIILLRKQKSKFTAELTITKIALKNQVITEFNLHIRDITKQIIQQQKMVKLAFHDTLTGLYNRSFFIKKLQQEIDYAIRHGASVTLMFLDLDQFKRVNDKLGHKAGDAVLLTVSKRLNINIREGDIICRWGGDEFIMLFPEMTKKSVIVQKAHDILQSICVPFNFEGKELDIRISIGIAKSGEDIISADQLIQNADMALYAAKNKGRNTYCFYNQEMETLD